MKHFQEIDKLSNTHSSSMKDNEIKSPSQDRIDRIKISIPKGEFEASGLPESAFTKVIWLMAISTVFLLVVAVLTRIL